VVRLQLTVDAPDSHGRRALRIHGRAGDGEWTLFATGTLGPGDQSVLKPAGADGLDASAPDGSGSDGSGSDGSGSDGDSDPIPGTELYAGLAEAGFAYGPMFQGLDALRVAPGGAVLAELTLPEPAASDAGRYGLHPALLDAALHAAARLDLGPDTPDGEPAAAGSAGRLPFAWADVCLHATGAAAARARLVRLGPDNLALELTTVTGEPILSVGRLNLRPVDGHRMAAETGPAPLRLDWQPRPLPDGPSGDVVVYSVLGTGPALPPIGHRIDTFDQVGTGPVVAVLETGTQPNVASRRALELVQGWLRRPSGRLTFLTQGAIGPERTRPVDEGGAAAAGLVRSAISEHPGRFALLDVDHLAPGHPANGHAANGHAANGHAGSGRPDGGQQPGATSADVLRAALATEHPEAALRDGALLVPRATEWRAGDELLPVPAEGTWTLGVRERGTLDGLVIGSDPRGAAPLAPGEVRIAVRAAGVNFRDVLNALGMYPGDAPDFGLEGAGVVLETGDAVRDIAVGDRVLGMFPGAFGPVAVADHRAVAPLPRGWTFAQGAAFPVAYLTAYYAMTDLAEVGPGTAVLVHAAAGGVGTAAVQIARHLGAEVHGTASPGKWDALAALGLHGDHVSSSRTLEFEQRVMRATGGRGVDVVLDALAGEFVDASLRLLPRGGSFLEMGKTDVRDPDTVATAHPGVAYRAFDLVEAGADRIGQLLRGLLALVEQGAITAPPVTAWDVREARAAFRHLSGARHVGKVVLTVPAALDPEGTVLITGGLGGLGATLARHLVTRHGVRHLLLTGRRGAHSPHARELCAELGELGAEVTVAARDVSDREQVTALLAGVPDDHPLTAVVHAAGVLDDRLIEHVRPESLDAVLAPKVDGARHLHELTRDADLARFVLLSSSAGALGAPGQGAYAAANSALDALARRRAADGLPATATAFGPWTGVGGMTASLSESDRARMVRSGVPPLGPDEGRALFDAAWEAPSGVALALLVDRSALARLGAALPPVLSGLAGGGCGAPGSWGRSAVAGSGRADDTDDTGSGSAGEDYAERLRDLDAGARRRTLVGLVGRATAAVLGHSGGADVDPDHSFAELGVDSLTAVELRNRLSARTGLLLPSTVVFDHPNATALARHLEDLIIPAGRAPVPTAAPPVEAEPVADLSGLDVDDLVRMAMSPDGS